LGRPGALAGS
jgi:hypothetical protein